MAKPKILLLDEPSLGLAPLLVKKIFEIIQAIAGVEQLANFHACSMSEPTLPRNPVLREAIAMTLAPRHVRAFDRVFFDGDAKEAVAFAFLGWLHLHGRTSNVPSATGARGPRVLGAFHPA